MRLNVDALKQVLDTRPDFGWREHFVELGLNIGFNTTGEEAAKFGLGRTKGHLSGYFYVADREKFMELEQA